MIKRITHVDATFLAASALLTLAAPANAIDWANRLALGDFDAGTSWVGGVAPGPADSADFPSLSVSATVRYNGINPTTTSMTVDDSDVTLRSFSFQHNEHTIAGSVRVSAGGALTLGNASNTPLDLTVLRTLDIFDGSTFNVRFDSNVQANLLAVGAWPGAPSVANIDGAGSNLHVSSDALIGLQGATGTLNFINSSTNNGLQQVELAGGMSNNSTGILNVMGGSQVSTGPIVAGNAGVAGQAGKILVDGANSRITQTGASTLKLGSASNSQGNLTIANGGTFETGKGTTTINTTGTVTINQGGTFDADGPIDMDGGKLLVNVGGTLDFVSGQTLTAINGAQLEINTDYSMRNQAFEINTGAKLTTGSLSVGDLGYGFLTVDGSGSELMVAGDLKTLAEPPDVSRVTLRNSAVANISGDLSVARNSLVFLGADAVVSVESGADMTVGGDILIGKYITFLAGQATLNITGVGSTLTQNGTSSITVSDGAPTLSTVSITDSGRLNTGTGVMNIGLNGRVNVNTNGVLESKGDLKITGGRVNVTSGGLINTGACSVSLSAPGEINVNTGGMMVIGDGAPVGSSDRVEVTANGVLKGTGTVNVAFGLTNTGGTVAPGLSVGTLTVNGVFTNGGDRSATLEIEIDAAGAAGTDYDQLIVSGAAFTDGTLDFQLGGAYSPTLGDEFDFLSVGGSIVSTFDVITHVVQSDDLGLAVRYGYDAGQVDMRVSRRGDVDFDDDIDTADLTAAIIGFNGASGSGSSWVKGDYDGDGDTDTVDLTTAILNYTGAQAGATNVPDLIYDPATGNATIDADGADVISFSLQGGPFSPANFSELPAGLTDNIASQIGWTSFNLFSGLTGKADLGPILPTGLTLPQLETKLTTASYGLALSGGGGGGRLDIIIPEPGSFALLAFGVAMLVRRPTCRPRGNIANAMVACRVLQP